MTSNCFQPTKPNNIIFNRKIIINFSEVEILQLHYNIMFIVKSVLEQNSVTMCRGSIVVTIMDYKYLAHRIKRHMKEEESGSPG